MAPLFLSMAEEYLFPKLIIKTAGPGRQPGYSCLLTRVTRRSGACGGHGQCRLNSACEFVSLCFGGGFFMVVVCERRYSGCWVGGGELRGQFKPNSNQGRQLGSR
jgi:hypothetical protein